MDAFKFKASAATVTSGTTGNCTWTLDGTVLTISGNGAMENYCSLDCLGNDERYCYCYCHYWVDLDELGHSCVYPSRAPWSSNITDVIIENGVTSIGDETFNYCYNLNSITIPDSVTRIGSKAFYYCYNLTNITIPDSVTHIGYDAFYNTPYYNNSNNWVDNVLYIGNHHLIKAKDSISGSYSVKEGTTTIADDAFYDCTNLTNIDIPNSITSIGDWTFGDCTSLESILFPNSLTNIGYHAFHNCTSLESINLPNSLTHIGFNAFSECYNLANINIPDSVTNIDSLAFSSCRSLTNITIPDSVTNIGYEAFRGCYNLSNINVSENNNNYCSQDGVLYDKDKTTLICYPARKTGTSYSIPDNVTNISGSAFEKCTNLTTINIPNSVTSIAQSAFSGCSNLNSVFYRGSSQDKSKIHIGYFNTPLTSATWYYNSCIGNTTVHTYDNACDTTCNICNAIRTITHNYVWVVDKVENCGVNGKKHKECTICNIKQSENTIIPATGNHVYDNTCDTICNVCNATRTIIHTYSNECDRDCNICGAFRRAPHEYVNVCDDTCNSCGEVREPIAEHTYTNSCDTICNECGKVRTITIEHTYSNSCDIDCNMCGFIRVVEHTFTNECDAECDICYQPRKSPHKYDNACDNECNLCGEKRTVPDHTYGDDPICDECGYNKYTPGDINDSGDVSLIDVVTLAQYLAEWDVECNENALDLNGDGDVTLQDVVHLAQYLAEWEDIVLH